VDGDVELRTVRRRKAFKKREWQLPSTRGAVIEQRLRNYKVDALLASNQDSALSHEGLNLWWRHGLKHR
jgi:hypothetical protein